MKQARSWWWALPCAALLLVTECGTTPKITTVTTIAATTSAPSASISTAPAASIASAPVLEELPLITDVDALRVLEAHGAALGAVLDDTDAIENDALMKHPRYASIVQTIVHDVADAHSADPASGVGIAKGHRLLDVRALSAHDARFELIGVSSRLDRAFSEPQACGELRLLYRLSYATTKGGTAIASRLPVTLAITFFAKGSASTEDCRAIASHVRAPLGLHGAALAEWAMHDGPLADLSTLRARFRSVEVNAQIVRWPSTLRPDLGGHAEYLLRVFRTREGQPGLAPSTLENTPDVARLKKDDKLRAELLAFVRDEQNLARIDAGIVLLPEKFLATRAISVSPRGLARRQNRPFRQLFEKTAFEGLALSSRAFASSPSALLRRLDELSCVGCHQSRGVAGFHLLGEETAAPSSPNAIAVALSPHLLADLPRRKARVKALATSATFDDVAAIAERSPDEPGVYGAHCGLGDAGFARWTCNAGLSCVLVDASSDDRDVGACLPEHAAVGDPCELGLVSPDADGHRDRVASKSERACGGSRFCEANSVGFPDGMCASTCGELGADSICAGVPILVDFNACLAKSTPFETCISDHTSPTGVRTCAIDRPCRDDYVCARTPSGQGACMPPYFLFQLRVDGHP